ncbi:prepilin-type N-terminal cleavage/methylation domain-containing protein [Planococcus versutus]|uniref:Tfp assembly type protein n=1 Tax=Planococcus versutus TaxID=1302659 RepID=A0A1B1RXH7_9BACL|nr:prepilin-type N-terminal cleavage/methylation domain-containing protein [Planococcus versutus]ANU25645.1 Tfp assembly type protein [Planococcus versutus]
MKNYLQKKLNNEKGMTLIELLAVIVIIAIIAAIAIPAIGNIIENSRYSAVKSDATNSISAANIYFTENPDKTSVSAKVLKDDGYLDSPGKLPATTTGTAAGSGITVFTNSNPIKISTPAITYSTGKTLTFTNASIELINADDKKGSEDPAAKTIPAQ